MWTAALAIPQPQSSSKEMPPRLVSASDKSATINNRGRPGSIRVIVDLVFDLC